jgi:hypothetical protein
MPISYNVLNDGHFIHAKTSGNVTSQEFIDYEVLHAIDKRLKAPIAELIEVENDSLKYVSENDISQIMDQREKNVSLPNSHRCAIVVSLGDIHAWNLARFYEEMVTLHYPESVVVFGDTMVARTWLGMDDNIH